MGLTQAPQGVEPPKIKEGRPVPLFYLPSVVGGDSVPASLRSKYNMVLLFLEGGPDTELYLQSITPLLLDIESEQARLIAVIAQPLHDAKALAARLNARYTLLADEGGATTARMLGRPGAALCVADRYGTTAYIEIKENAAQLSPPQTALSWLDFVQIQCPE